MPFTAKTKDWFAVAAVPLGMVLAALATLLSVHAGIVARLLFAAGFFCYGASGILRQRLLFGQQVQLLRGNRAIAAGAAFALVAVLIALPLQ